MCVVDCMQTCCPVVCLQPEMTACVLCVGRRVRRCQSALCEAHIVSPHLALPPAPPAASLSTSLPACSQQRSTWMTRAS